MTVAQLPDRQFVNGPGSPLRSSQPLTEANLKVVLAFLGCTLRFNVMTHTVEYRADGALLKGLDADRALIAIQDTLVMVDIKALGRLEFMLSTIARQDSYHPMQEWLAGLSWDGVDRLEPLIASVRTSTRLWPVFLENWLVQVVDGVCGWDRASLDGLPHCLVLCGAQGVGKSRWLRMLGGEWLLGEAELHLSSYAGKDHQINVLRWPMAELSELDGIFKKAEVETMKAFISRHVDSIREPYGRKAVERPRMTAFCGSVNTGEFLTDTTGSRRWWPVEVDSIDWTFSADRAQIWAQAYALWQEDPVFALPAELDAERESTARDRHTNISAEVEMVAAYYEAHQALKSTYQAMNRTEILQMLGYLHPSPAARTKVGEYLIQMLGKHRTIDKKQRAWLFPYSEFARNLQDWPRKKHLSLVSSDTDIDS